MSPTGSRLDEAPGRGDLGLRAIIAWKLFKAALAAAYATAVAWPGPGVLSLLQRLATWLSEEVRSMELRRVGAFLSDHATPGALKVTALLSLASAANNLVQGIGLHYRRRWAAWLTVVITSAFIPVQLVELFRRPRPAGLALISANVLVVAYLARTVRSHPSLWRERRNSGDPGGAAGGGHGGEPVALLAGSLRYSGVPQPVSPPDFTRNLNPT